MYVFFSMMYYLITIFFPLLMMICLVWPWDVLVFLPERSKVNEVMGDGCWVFEIVVGSSPSKDIDSTSGLAADAPLTTNMVWKGCRVAVLARMNLPLE